MRTTITDLNEKIAELKKQVDKAETEKRTA